MAQIRQGPMGDDGATVAGFPLGRPDGFPSHAHDTHQLTIAASGVLVMGIGDRGWVVPPSRGLWIPAGVDHSVGSIGASAMTALWFAPARCPIDWPAPTAVPLTALLRPLVSHLAAEPLEPAERARAEAVLFDLLRPLPDSVSLDLPMPDDDRARRVAQALVDDPADPRTLAEWGRSVGASDRTLLRQFRTATGLGFHEWRNRARVIAALPLLAAGRPVQLVASQVGFASASSFGAAFRRELGASPSGYASR